MCCKNTLFSIVVVPCRFDVPVVVTFPSNVIVADFNVILPSDKEIFSEDFVEWLEKNNVVIIHKPHFNDREKSVDKFTKNPRVIEIKDIAPYTLMAASDVHISDYSSCILDFLVFDRPIIHFLYDYEQFQEKSRELYYKLDEFTCGTVAKNSDELQKAIIESINFPDAQKDLRRKRREKFMTYEGPDSCEKIYNFVVQKLSQ